MIPARGPQTGFLYNLCYAILAMLCNGLLCYVLPGPAGDRCPVSGHVRVKGFSPLRDMLSLGVWVSAVQSVLCNLCYAIFAMQSLQCNLCCAISAMQSGLGSFCYAILALQSLQFNLWQSLLCNLCYAIWTKQFLLCNPCWLAGWLAGWLTSCLAGWMAGWMAWGAYGTCEACRCLREAEDDSRDSE